MSSSDGEPEVGAGRAMLGRMATRDGSKLRFQLLFFLNFVAFSGFVVFRNVYLEEMGLSGSAMGHIGFLMLASGVVAQPVWGLVSDYFRAERTVLIVGALLSAVALLSYPVGDDLAEPFLLIAVGTVAYSVFRAPVIPVATGMVLDRGYDYGSVRAFGSLAFAIGSLGFGFLVATLGSVSIVYFYVVGAVAIVAIAWTLPEDAGTDDEESDDGPSLSEAARALVTNRNFVVVVAASFLLRLSAMGGEAFFSVFMRTVEARIVLGPLALSPDGMTGVAWAINSGIEAVAFLYALRSELSYKWLLVAGGVILSVPNLVYGLTTEPWVLLAVQSLGGVGFAMASVAAVDLAHDAAAERVTSTAQTLLTGLGYGLGGAVGQVVAGSLYDVAGIQPMYVGIGVLGVLGAGVGLFVIGGDGEARTTSG